MRMALYPGTFDPVTEGHLSLLRRGRQVFDKIFVAVADRTPKPALFTQSERVQMLKESTAGMPHVEVLPFSGLTVDFAEKIGCCSVLRGLRALSDFESEFQLALMNRRLNPNVETVFLITDYRWLYISSTILKSAVSNGASVKGLVPEPALSMLRERLDPSLKGKPGSRRTERTQEETPAGEKGPEETKKRIAVYPGTFDPITNGHLSIIERGLSSFDEIVVAVASNAGKHPLFDLETRVQLAKEATAPFGKGVSVYPYSNLTVDFAMERGACAMIRGLRATGDFEYEFQLALMNRRIQNKVQTVFLMTDYEWLYVSSSIIKAAASHGGDIRGLVPRNVLSSLKDLYSRGAIRQSTPCLGAPQGGYGKPSNKEPQPK